MLKNINVSVSPHIRKKDTTSSIMLDVCIALLFPLAAGVYTFGWRALAVILISVATCVVSEFGATEGLATFDKIEAKLQANPDYTYLEG